MYDVAIEITGEDVLYGAGRLRVELMDERIWKS